MPPLKIGTRKSPLALAQAQEVRDLLMAAHPGLEVELVSFTTSGDKITDRPLSEAGGKGLFTKELEEALLDRRVDVAVHSMKDMATILPDGLTVGCMLEREDPRDMLVGEGIHSLDDLPQGASFGTSSLRRSAQILMHRPDLNIVPLRGNVQTRLGKLAEGQMRATMLARAGLNRLKLWDVPGAVLSTEQFLPAVAQGAVGLECREEDEAMLALMAPLADIDTEMAVLCERAFLRVLDGSCRTPIAGYATIDGSQLHLRGLIVKPDGSASHSVDISGDARDAESLGQAAGQQLLEKAGENFL
jgi:hydroxymethylbilane synthase